jgi:hypothetical protein
LPSETVQTEGFMRCLTGILLTFLRPIPAMAVELFHYRGAAKDVGTLEYVFEAGEQNSPNAVTREQAAEIAANFMTTFYHYRSARWKRRSSGQQLVPSAFRTRSNGQCDKCFLVVLLPDGTALCRAWRSSCERGSPVDERLLFLLLEQSGNPKPLYFLSFETPKIPYILLIFVLSVDTIFYRHKW